MSNVTEIDPIFEMGFNVRWDLSIEASEASRKGITSVFVLTERYRGKKKEEVEVASKLERNGSRDD